METEDFFTKKELPLYKDLWARLKEDASEFINNEEFERIHNDLSGAIAAGSLKRNIFGMNPIIKSLQVACIIFEDMSLRRASIIAVLMNDLVMSGYYTLDDITKLYGDDIAKIIKGIKRVGEIYSKSPTVESDNFRDLLISFAEDMRVILILIADRVNIMRQIRDTEKKEDREKVANEAMYLYAPLAHKLGLYKIKSELEDLWVKYIHHDVYYQIKEDLNATKSARDKYITQFVEPLEKRLKAEGLNFHIKSRTKSIHSIWKKMQKQNVPFEKIYDLFAIRIILDCELKNEKKICWQAFSIVTDEYRPNPKRLRDWLSIPKSNGYESLHITVMGPEGKWVEVQIRTERMDDIAERGLAAHWRYKGVKDEGGLDDWLKSVREALESTDESDMQIMDQFKRDLYDDEVFIFSPKGDLFKLPKGATILDFAFMVHTNIGRQCIGGKVNDRVVPIRQVLNSGDQVSIITSPTQKPKKDWLKIVTTSRAKSKIKQILKEEEHKYSQLGRENLERKFKNRKIEINEGIISRLIQASGYKNEKVFYQELAEEKISLNDFFEKYIQQIKKDNEPAEETTIKKAEEFTIQKQNFNKKSSPNKDILVIDRNMKDIDYKLAKCCNPIYGDDVFAFVNASGGIKIHRTDCPNAPSMLEKFGYRILQAQWDGKSAGSQYDIVLRIVGHDDIGIINNITNIINKEENVLLRSISVSSEFDMFSGMMVVSVNDKIKLEQLIKKIQGVKGVMNVTRE